MADRPAVVIGVPSYKMIDPATMFSLFGLIFRAGPLVIDLSWNSGIYVDLARNTIVREMLDSRTSGLMQLPHTYNRRATHLLFLDDDMTWPADIVERLLRWNKDVVAGIYYFKTPPHRPVYGNFIYTEEEAAHRNEGDRKKVNQPMDVPVGLTRADCVGSGCMLVRTSVFREMRERYKDEFWFRSEECGEELHFFWRLRQMGIDCFLDPSVECGHLGKLEVKRRHFESYHGEDNATRTF